jgi:hypothetical protein
MQVVAGCVPRPASLGGQLVSPPGGESPTSSPAVPQPAATLAGPTASPSFTRPTPLPAPTFLAYTVKSGDTLTSIAREFGTTPRSIAFWSRGEHPSLDPESTAYEPDRLELGWVLLVIPDSVFDEDELMDSTPGPAPSASSGASRSPTAG